MALQSHGMPLWVEGRTMAPKLSMTVGVTIVMSCFTMLLVLLDPELVVEKSRIVLGIPVLISAGMLMMARAWPTQVHETGSALRRKGTRRTATAKRRARIRWVKLLVPRLVGFLIGCIAPWYSMALIIRVGMSAPYTLQALHVVCWMMGMLLAFLLPYATWLTWRLVPEVRVWDLRERELWLVMKLALRFRLTPRLPN